ncbi:MAG: undecaprenyl-phosphate glucose phosphotransferase [Candidatus Hatepunaea meridiana]|nr:undecaprenyl-phosphate glucose phosphotransferase [Candidatus Hatepunaea meridiana]
MKSSIKIWLPVIALLLDASAIIIGVWLAYFIRFSEVVTAHIPIVTGLPPISWYAGLSLVFTTLTLLSLQVGGLYRFPRQDNLFDELTVVFKFYILAFILLLALLFFYREASFSRLTMALMFFSCAGLLVSLRIIVRRLREKLYSMGVGVRRAAIVGEGQQIEPIIEHIAKHPEFGFEIVGNIGSKSIQTEGFNNLGIISNAGQTVRKHKLDTLIIAPSAEESGALPTLVKACYGVNVDFLFLPDIHPASGRPKKVIDVGGVPLWTLKESPFTGWLGIVKRAFDIIVASFLLLFTLPVLIVIVIAIKLNSSGPLLYRQRRIGLDGREFDCLKFRSMKTDAEVETGAVWAKAGDTRVTKVGKILRRWSLDELPQFWNVIRGDMSLVGPRPERPKFVHEFEQRIDGYHERHRVRAGLTGWSQVNGLRGDTSIEERTVYDRYYVENWSLLFDLKIMVMTAKAVVKGENSY